MESRVVDNLPPVIRGAGSKNAEEREQILSWLTDGSAHVISNVADRQAHNRLQQKIRSVAKAKGINVTVRYYVDTQETGFQATEESNNNKKTTKKATAHAE